MKTIIIYSSKHGSCEKISKILSQTLNSEMINIRENNNIEISKYDKILIGGSIYAGTIDRKLKKFIKINLKELLTKKIGLYICGLLEDEFQKEFEESYPKELRDKAIISEKFKGEIIYNKLTMIEKIIISNLMKTKKNILNLETEKIKKFARKFEID
ncbi:MAG: flavodoxin [Candidatus Woesearchaeota archaeon]|jgi:menaquinone-dependent protoporphyrinogen oxidase|nr:flavodoxin [Candidatus Woesearchaeota archaeon]